MDRSSPRSQDCQTKGGLITTERLLLRPLGPSDSDSVFALRSDPDIYYWRTPDDRQKSDEWLKGRLESDRNMCYTVSLIPSDTRGSSEPQFIGLKGAHNLPELGYIFRPYAWGKGYATEALQGWIDMYRKAYPDGHPVLSEEKAGYLKAVTGPGGDSSRRILRKCGFELYKEEEVSKAQKGSKEKGKVVVHEEFRLYRP